MAKIAGVDVAKIIAKEVGKVLTDAVFQLVVTSITTKQRGVLLSEGPTTLRADSVGKGIMSAYASYNIDGTTIRHGDRQILILAGTLVPAVVPKPDDEISMEGGCWKVVSVVRDPASATYICQVRGL